MENLPKMPGLCSREKEITREKDVCVKVILSGQMRKYRIKVMAGDRVQITVSPYDPSHRIISYRLK